MSQTEAVTTPVTQAHAEPEQEKPEKQEEKPQQKETENKRLSSGTESDDDDPVGRFRFFHSPTATVTRQTASLRRRTPMLIKQATDPDDNFEDAVAHSPARSLTKRSTSYLKSQTPAQDAAAEEPSDRKSGETDRSEDKRVSKTGDAAAESDDEVESLHEKPLPRRKSSSVSKRISSTSNLDNVSLDDDDGPPPPPRKRRLPHPSLIFDLY